MFEVIPAIDVRGGRCVRLFQGDYARETVFGYGPLAMARAWQEQGARRLHLVDLDGARDGRPVQHALIARVLASVSARVQVGGGYRRMEDIASILAAGADRVVLGTIAVKDPGLLARCLETYGPEPIVVSIDARDGRVATDGWIEGSDVSALDLAKTLAQTGVKRALYTDIARDGTLQGPNVEGVAKLVEQTGLAIIASGGVSSVEHLEALKGAGAEAAIVGRALYDGTLTLAAANVVATEEKC